MFEFFLGKFIYCPYIIKCHKWDIFLTDKCKNKNFTYSVHQTLRSFKWWQPFKREWKRIHFDFSVQLWLYPPKRPSLDALGYKIDMFHVSQLYFHHNFSVGTGGPLLLSIPFYLKCVCTIGFPLIFDFVSPA